MPEPSVGLLSLFRSRLFLIPAAVYLVVGLALAFLPFTNYLGLEFSLGVCIVAGFMGGPLAVSVFRRRIPGETMKARFAAASDIGGIALWLDASLLHGAAVLFSLIGLAASAFVSKPCAPLRGAGFFVLLPFVTVVYSSAWGLVFASLVRRPRRAKILVTVFALLTLAFTAIHFVTGTAVWVYNPFFGHFPGPNQQYFLTG